MTRECTHHGLPVDVYTFPLCIHELELDLVNQTLYENGSKFVARQINQMCISQESDKKQ